ncbi:MAG: TIGR02281 family clan AA aspartic protease, partial [Pseudolabrys sp.]
MAVQKSAGSAMRPILVFAIAALIVGSFGARFADRVVSERPLRAAAVQADAAPSSVSDSGYGRDLTLKSGPDGHFHTRARVDGQAMDFIIDTGATLVIIRESDAARVGFYPFPSDFTATVSTANGKVKAAPTKLDSIELGDITVFDVPALVLPDDRLWQNLLGMAFLSRL